MMKLKSISIFNGLLSLTLLLFMVACQKEEHSNDSFSGRQLTQRSNCNTDCLEEGEESDAVTFRGNYNVNFYTDVAVTNSTTHVIYRITSNKSIHYIALDGVKVFCSSTDNGGNEATQPYEIMVPLGSGWEACDVVAHSITTYRNNCNGVGAGNKVTISTTATLIGACPPCEEGFTYDHDGGTTYTFCYISEIPLTGAVVKFTCPHITGWTSTPTLYRVNPGGGPTVLQWIGNIDACEEACWTITFDPDCDQNQAGFANLWTDFKVNGVSKKNGATPNIVFDCE